jgi:hypothetical protein
VALDTISPLRVRFSQRSVSARFRDGRTIDELAELLRAGVVRPEDVEPIRLVVRNDLLFTLDNRRLEAFRRAGLDVPYRMATDDEIAAEAWKFTTADQGLTVRIRE